MESERLAGLPEHCPPGRRKPCRFCVERMARAEARRLGALAPPGTFWNTRIKEGVDVLGYWGPDARPDTGRGTVRYLKTPQPGLGRRRIRPMLAYGQRRQP